MTYLKILDLFFVFLACQKNLIFNSKLIYLHNLNTILDRFAEVLNYWPINCIILYHNINLEILDLSPNT